jgi:hypothetical protein
VGLSPTALPASNPSAPTRTLMQNISRLQWDGRVRACFWTSLESSLTSAARQLVPTSAPEHGARLARWQ